MAELLTHHLEPVVDQLLEGLDEPLGEVKGLIGKTDADFIDGEGSFSPKLKKDNNEAISGAIDAFTQTVKEKDVAALAEEAGLSPVSRAALFHVTRDAVALESWNHRAVGSQYERPLPTLPDSVSDIKPAFFDTADKLEEVVAWWRNDAPYFAYFESDSSVRVFPGRAGDNVAVSEDRPMYRSEVAPRSHVIAEFTGGQASFVFERDGEVEKIKKPEEARDVTVPILGWSGKADRHGDLSDFGSAFYDRFSFIGESGFESEVERTDNQLYAARVALAAVQADGPDDMPNVELPKPSDAYAEQVVRYLAHQTVRAFLPSGLKASVDHGGGGSMTGYRVGGVAVRRKESHLRGMTEGHLHMFLGAAGAGITEYVDAVQAEVAQMRGAEVLAGRIDAIKVQGGVDAFLDTLK